MDLYVCGHGGWGIVGRSGIFVPVPLSSEVVFYKQIGDVLLVREAEDILRRNRKALAPERTIRGGMQAPEMSLYPAREFWRNFGAAAQEGNVEWHAVATETRLSYFLERYPGVRLHWIACSVRELG